MDKDEKDVKEVILSGKGDELDLSGSSSLALCLSADAPTKVDAKSKLLVDSLPIENNSSISSVLQDSKNMLQPTLVELFESSRAQKYSEVDCRVSEKDMLPFPSRIEGKAESSSENSDLFSIGEKNERVSSTLCSPTTSAQPSATFSEPDSPELSNKNKTEYAGSTYDHPGSPIDKSNMNWLKRRRYSDLTVSARSKLRVGASTFTSKPAIYCRPKDHLNFESLSNLKNRKDSTSGNAEDFPSDSHCSVPCWPADPMAKHLQALRQSSNPSSDGGNTDKTAEGGYRKMVHKMARQKGVSSGRTYTSKYRGVHQTLPTRRWEAQFRRAGKPTSLGCFDNEEEAARAYDKMMVWIELHSVDQKSPLMLKGGATNFSIHEYSEDVPELNKLTQDELVQMLRREGRSQAAQNQANSLKSRSRITVCSK